MVLFSPFVHFFFGQVPILRNHVRLKGDLCTDVAPRPSRCDAHFIWPVKSSDRKGSFTPNSREDERLISMSVTFVCHRIIGIANKPFAGDVAFTLAFIKCGTTLGSFT